MIGRLHHAVLDCRDPAAVAEFYSQLLGWPVTYRSDDWVVVAANDTSSGLAFQLWPQAATMGAADPARLMPGPHLAQLSPGGSSAFGSADGGPAVGRSPVPPSPSAGGPAVCLIPSSTPTDALRPVSISPTNSHAREMPKITEPTSA